MKCSLHPPNKRIRRSSSGFTVIAPQKKDKNRTNLKGTHSFVEEQDVSFYLGHFMIPFVSVNTIVVMVRSHGRHMVISLPRPPTNLD